MRTLPILACLTVAALLLAGCSGSTPTPTGPVDATGAAPTGSTNGPGPGDPGGSGQTTPNPYTPPSTRTAVAGSGASFPKPIIESWAIQYQGLHPTVEVSYPGGGSSKGVTDITAKNVVFAGSDAPLRPDQKSAAPTVLQFPETLGAVAVVYNVEGVPNGIDLDGPTLGRIFKGDITRWDDPAIKALNPGVAFPGATITTVGRSDGSGTTFVFTDYLSKAATGWTASNAAIATVGTKQPGNDGVSSGVKNTANSIGYVELAFMKSQKLNGADIKNKAGEFVAPSSAGASKAAEAALALKPLPAPEGDWSQVSIVDPQGEGAYPIASFSYMLVHKSLADYGSKASANQLNAFRAWAWWALHDGQVYAEPLGYARLPPAAVKVGEDALAMMVV